MGKTRIILIAILILTIGLLALRDFSQSGQAMTQVPHSGAYL